MDFTDLVILARNYGSTLLTTGGHALSATTTAAAVAAALQPMVDFNELTNLMLKSRRRLLSDSGR